MPKLLNTDLEQLNTRSNYKFSAVKIEDLGASEYSLVTIVCDTSSSVEPFAPQLETMLKTVLKSCKKSPRADNLMLRLVQFADTVKELHGFRLLSTIQEDEYNNILQLGGMTALFDASVESVEVTETYGRSLMSQDFITNAIVFVITDGQNNRGRHMSPDEVKKAVEAAKHKESLESITVVLIGVTADQSGLDVYLKTFKDDANITQYVDIGNATPGKLAKLAQFVSSSISSTSSALGTGQASQLIQPTF